MADNQQQQSNAFQMAADVARDAKAISKIAAKAATGNVAGAAVDTLLNSQLMKRVLCGILASLFLITCCLYAIPTMIWEAVQNVVASGISYRRRLHRKPMRITSTISFMVQRTAMAAAMPCLASYKCLIAILTLLA